MELWLTKKLIHYTDSESGAKLLKVDKNVWICYYRDFVSRGATPELAFARNPYNQILTIFKNSNKSLTKYDIYDIFEELKDNNDIVDESICDMIIKDLMSDEKITIDTSKPNLYHGSTSYFLG